MKRTLLAIAASVAALAAGAQATARSALTTAPGIVLPELSESTRLDMLDYYDSGMKKPIPDIFGTECVLDTLGNDKATIRFGEHKTLSIYVLPYGKKELIMTVETLNVPQADSHIAFYSTKWEPIETKKFFAEPKLADWVGKLAGEKLVDIENALPFILYQADYDPSTGTLRLTSVLDGYVANENMPLAKEAVAKSLTYTWSGKRFK
ncbi:MAG: DUF3256 family protein [Muribaculaceae bacterium]|nr:DUF3256 family protein [Muribaculaceae bacterium]